MRWVQIQVDDLPTAKAAPLVAALQSVALGEDQLDPLPEIITNVTSRIRAEIAAGGRTRLDADLSKLPRSLKSLALRMVLREAQSRLNANGALPLSEDEREEQRLDIRYLERIADGKISVEQPDNPEPSSELQSSNSPTAPSIRIRPRKFKLSNQDGI